jgi:Uma2 family endonuclease
VDSTEVHALGPARMPGSDYVIPRDPSQPSPEGGGQGLKFTYDDFLQFPDDGRRHELIDGDHYSTPLPDIRHQRISGHLTLTIDLWLQDHPLGEILYAPLDVLLSNFDVVSIAQFAQEFDH